jgi:hypothetical protein
VSTADLAIAAMTAVTLTSTVLDHRHRMKIADRLRIVNPVKPPAPQKRDAAAEPAKTGPISLERAS